MDSIPRTLSRSLSIALAWVGGHVLILSVIATGLTTMAPGCADPAPTRVYGITPGELTVPGDVWIRGRNLDQPGITVELSNPANPSQTFPPLTINSIDTTPHGLRVSIPFFSMPRTQLDLVVKKGGTVVAPTVQGKSFALGVGSTPVPAAEETRFQFLSWGWVFNCDQNGNNCQEPFLHSLTPENPTFSDSWGDQPWADLRLLVDQTNRDWATICANSWSAPTPHSKHVSTTLDEKHPRQSFTWNPAFWLETDRTFPQAFPSAYPTGAGPLRAIARGSFEVLPGTETPFCQVTTCDQPYTGTMNDAVVVSIHGVLFFGGEEVDPNDPMDGFRSVTGTDSVSLIDDFLVTGVGCGGAGQFPCTDSYGLIIMSSNPELGSRPKPPVGGSVNPLIAGITSCTKDTCWWGPSHARDSTPNLLTHELFHLLTGVSEVGASSQSQIANTPLVGSDVDDGGSVRRGFEPNIPFVAVTPQDVCNRAIDGLGKDFTH